MDNFLIFGIGLCLVIGHRHWAIGSAVVLLGIGIYNYQDEVQEFANKVIEKTMGLAEAAKEKILSLLGEMKEKIMNVQYPFVPNSNPIQPRRGTECSGKNNSKIKLPPKFLQNLFVGCLWST